MRSFACTLLPLAAVVLAAAAPATRHLVFDYRTPTERGQVVVDAGAVRPDGGLPVILSERGGADDGLSAACVVYDSTAVVCGRGSRIGAEALALARLLGPNFLNPSRDRWRVASIGRDVFAVVGVTDSGTVRIRETRTGRGAMTAAIVYDRTMGIPITIVETDGRRRLRITLVGDSAALPSP